MPGPPPPALLLHTHEQVGASTAQQAKEAGAAASKAVMASSGKVAAAATAAGSAAAAATSTQGKGECTSEPASQVCWWGVFVCTAADFFARSFSFLLPISFLFSARASPDLSEAAEPAEAA